MTTDADCKTELLIWVLRTELRPSGLCGKGLQARAWVTLKQSPPSMHDSVMAV